MKYYFESNQMFIKSYYQTILENYDDVYAVYLWRNPMDVALSCWKKFKNQELDWFIQSHWRKNILRTDQKLSFYENAVWQWYEVKERWLRYKHKFVDTFEFDFEKINDVDEWKRFFKKPYWNF